jgi:hypothetical protein
VFGRPTPDPWVNTNRRSSLNLLVGGGGEDVGVGVGDGLYPANQTPRSARDPTPSHAQTKPEPPAEHTECFQIVGTGRRPTTPDPTWAATANRSPFNAHKTHSLPYPDASPDHREHPVEAKYGGEPQKPRPENPPPRPEHGVSQVRASPQAQAPHARHTPPGRAKPPKPPVKAHYSKEPPTSNRSCEVHVSRGADQMDPITAATLLVATAAGKSFASQPGGKPGPGSPP